MSEPGLLSAEVAASKLAAIFVSVEGARAAATRLRNELRLEPAQVQLILPGDRRAGRRLEPESHGIFLTLLRAHAALGIAGAVVGLAVFAAIYAFGVPFVVASPMLAGIAIVFLATMAGLMLGGLMTLRPDHDVYIHKVREACGEGRSAVVVHAYTPDQRAQAERLLKGASGDVVGTL